MVSIFSIFLAMNILYFFNLIPPIPLSLKDGGIYHSLYRDARGNYVVESEDTGWFGFLSPHENFHTAAGEPVYAYTSIFSPSFFNTGIIHEWQRYDEQTRVWTTVNRIILSVTGGRNGGYRTYSVKNNLLPGPWRVNVETSRGQIIGRLRFKVITVDTNPALETIIKD